MRRVSGTRLLRDAVAPAISSTAPQPGKRTIVYVESCPICRSRHSGLASSGTDGHADRARIDADCVGTTRLPRPAPVRTGFWPSLALPRSPPSLTWPRYGRSRGSRTWCCPYPGGIRPPADERSTHSEGSSDSNFEATHAASALAAYASRRASPHAMQGSLPDGWLTFTGRELNPLDRNERFQNFMFILPLRLPACASPVAYLFRFRGPRDPPLFVLALAALPDG